MSYRTLAHAMSGTSELKVWVVTAKAIAAPRTFITREWIRTVYLSKNRPTTFTRRRVQPENFELNEKGDWEVTDALEGQAMYNTDHGYYVYEWSEMNNEWVRTDFFEPGEAPVPSPEKT